MSIFTKRRTVRKFENKKIDDEILLNIVDAARLAPYPANVQPIKFMIIREKADSLFKYTKWAGYLPDGAPKDGEKPNAYIVILGDKAIKKNADFTCEAAIAGATISIAAEAEGVGACWLGAIDRDGIRNELSVSDDYTIEYLIALGYSNMKSKAVALIDDVKYYFDEDNVLCVPKQSMEKILLKID